MGKTLPENAIFAKHRVRHLLTCIFTEKLYITPMPKTRQLLLGLLAVIFLFHSDFSTSAQDNHTTTPQETYLQIYLSIQEAERLESNNQLAEARGRYQKSLQQLQQLKQDYSDWEPVIVRYRINFCKEKLDRLKGSSAGEDVPSTPPPAVATPVIIPQQANPPTLPPSADSDIAIMRARIQSLENELAVTKNQLATVSNENFKLKDHQQELEEQIAKLRSDTTGEAKYNDLLSENTKLKAQMDEIKASGMSSEQVKQLQNQLAQTQSKLTEATNQATSLQAANDEFRKQLETLKSQLTTAQDQSKQLEPLAQENGVLRDVINRTLKGQARRDAARRLVDEELKNLKVESAVLKTQIDILTSPAVELSAAERDLLRTPTVQVSIDPSNSSIATPLNQGVGDYSSKPRVPTEFKDVAEEAVKLFASRQFDAAAAKYQMVLNAYPDSLYALSNLGVVRFQQGNYPEAEKMLREAVQVAPQDAFSHSILGIVLYQQGKYDEAVSILTRAVALDPNDAKSRNYLGISASQKGWQESAEQELRKAIELDPNYGDAHFNLAVIYATQKPPTLEMARRHYSRALELGIPRDEQLEKIINPTKM